MYKLIYFLLIPVFLIGKPLTVADAINCAKTGNKDILIERKALTEKRLELVKSITNYLPSVNLSGSWGKNGTDQPYNSVLDSSYNAGVSLSQPIFNYNLLENINASNIDKVKEELSFKVLVRTVEINTITKFYSVMAFKSKLKAAEFLLASSKENFNMVEQKYKLGSADRSEFLKAKVDYLNARINYNTLKSQLNVAKNDLFSYIGLNADTFELVDDMKMDSISLPDADSLKSKLVKYDPEILSARLNLQYIVSSLRRAVSSFLPTVNWNISYSTRLDSFPKLSNWKNGDSWSTSISLSLPLFNSGGRAIEIAEGKVSYQKAKLSYAKKLDERMDDLMSQISELRTSYITYQSAKSADELAEENYNINNLLYRKGSISQIEYYDAKRGYEEAEANLIKAKYSLLTNKLKLDIMIGSWKGD